MTHPCRWPSCEYDEESYGYSISLDGEVWWCGDHVDDAFLPELQTGVQGTCAQCGVECFHWLNATPLHRRCLRSWVAGIAEAKAPSTRLVGAYARRRASTSPGRG